MGPRISGEEPPGLYTPGFAAAGGRAYVFGGSAGCECLSVSVWVVCVCVSVSVSVSVSVCWWVLAPTLRRSEACALCVEQTPPSLPTKARGAVWGGDLRACLIGPAAQDRGWSVWVVSRVLVAWSQSAISSR
eukprot:181071-Rhodomonas_salina.2